jgi:ribonuclease Z
VDLDVIFIGTAGSAPTARRALPATLVRRGGDRLLFDCGEGTQRQLLRSVGLIELEEVFLTHFHADHFLGLPGMLKTFSLRGRELPLTVYGPPGLEALFVALRPVVGKATYDLDLVELEPNQPLERDGYLIAPFAVDHRVAALGYALVENDRPGRFDDHRAIELGVAAGPDFGRLQNGEAVTAADGREVHPEDVLGPSRPGRKIVLAGDTAPAEGTRALAHQADLLVHEATFLEDAAARAQETGHSTARAAAELAAAAEARMLALTHVSPRYAGPELREEAREVFENTIVPRDLDRVEIPFPERGEPVHVRWDGGSAPPAAPEQPEPELGTP